MHRSTRSLFVRRLIYLCCLVSVSLAVESNAGEQSQDSYGFSFTVRDGNPFDRKYDPLFSSEPPARGVDLESLAADLACLRDPKTNDRCIQFLARTAKMGGPVAYERLQAMQACLEYLGKRYAEPTLRQDCKPDNNIIDELTKYAKGENKIRFTVTELKDAGRAVQKWAILGLYRAGGETMLEDLKENLTEMERPRIEELVKEVVAQEKPDDWKSKAVNQAREILENL